MWTCPKCQREFEKPNQWHSCGDFSIDKLFLGKTEGTIMLFHHLMEMIDNLGDVNFEPVQTAIRVSRQKKLFAMVRILKNSINMEIVLKRKVEDFLILKAVKINKTDYAHFLKFYDQKDITNEIMSWIKEAYHCSKD